MALMTWPETPRNGVGMPLRTSVSFWAELGTNHVICSWIGMRSLLSTAALLMDFVVLKQFRAHRYRKLLWNPFRLSLATSQRRNQFLMKCLRHSRIYTATIPRHWMLSQIR